GARLCVHAVGAARGEARCGAAPSPGPPPRRAAAGGPAYVLRAVLRAGRGLLYGPALPVGGAWPQRPRDRRAHPPALGCAVGDGARDSEVVAAGVTTTRRAARATRGAGRRLGPHGGARPGSGRRRSDHPDAPDGPGG